MLLSSLRPDAVTCSVAVSACGDSGQWPSALATLRAMLRLHVTCDTTSCTSAIGACSLGGQWQFALEVLESMPRLRAVPDVISCDALMGACGKAGFWSPSLRLLDGMPRLRVAPRAVSYNAGLDACRQAGQWECALALLMTMPRLSILPDIVSCSSAVGACGEAVEWRLGLVLFDCISELHVRPDYIFYNEAISACGESFQWQAALWTLRRMPGSSSSPSAVSYCTVIASVPDLSVAEGLLREAFDRGFFPKLLRRNGRYLDLHYLTKPAALVAVRWWLSDILPRVVAEGATRPLGIITGWGSSVSTALGAEARVRAAVDKGLRAWGLPTLVSRNPGLLVVKTKGVNMSAVRPRLAADGPLCRDRVSDSADHR